MDREQRVRERVKRLSAIERRKIWQDLPTSFRGTKEDAYAYHVDRFLDEWEERDAIRAEEEEEALVAAEDAQRERQLKALDRIGTKAKPSSKLVTRASLNKTLEAAGAATGKVIKQKLAPRDKLVKQLQARIIELEERRNLHDAGVWREGVMHMPGAVVSYRGSAWVCRTGCKDVRPGTSEHWRLMIKRGRDAR
jgi:hypothetical protein